MSPGPASPFAGGDHAKPDFLDNITAVADVFEGPEKKLSLSFRHTETSLAKNRGLLMTGLRSLCRADIQTVLDAAVCKVLSITSNDSMDAYLLSESSLFVADLTLMIKTCGTTTLLKALPVILNLAVDKLGLRLISVQFSRVSYLYPTRQPFPHDSLAHEINYLNGVLETEGAVFRPPSLRGSEWLMYTARFDKDMQASGKLGVPGILEADNMQEAALAQTGYVLEIFMFDLDPEVMKQFTFQHNRTALGKDMLLAGTTSSSGIGSLLRDGTIVDAFNFEPCGYSMNGLLGDRYYTVHVSPEPGASYVSFETTTTKAFQTELVAEVVGLFRPARFTVALVRNAATDLVPHDPRTGIAWPVLAKLLHPMYVCEDTDVGFHKHSLCGAEVSSFTRPGSYASVCSPARSCDIPCFNKDLEVHLTTVAALCGARYANDRFDLQPVVSEGIACPSSEELRHPHFVIDLGKLATNISWIHKAFNGSNSSVRYVVRCNSDKAVLTLLAKLNVRFEASTASEIRLLRKIGAARRSIALVTPAVTAPLMKLFGVVGSVAVFQKPSKTFSNALASSRVSVEIHVKPSSISDLRDLTHEVARTGSSIVSIVIDLEHESGDALSPSRYKAVRMCIQHVYACIAALPDGLRTDVIVMLGDYSTQSSALGVFDRAVEICRKAAAVISDRPPIIGVDVSRLVIRDSVSLTISVTGRRSRQEVVNTAEGMKNVTSYKYYMNDGIYGAFGSVVMHAKGGHDWSHLNPRVLENRKHAPTELPLERSGHAEFPPRAIAESPSQHKNQNEYMSTLFGPTCDALDRIWVGMLPVLDIGDRVMFSDMGAYSSTTGCTFNGFGRHYETSYVVSAHTLQS